MTRLEELQRVVRGYTHPFDGPIPIEIPAAVREAGVLEILGPRLKTGERNSRANSPPLRLSHEPYDIRPSAQGTF